MKRIHFPNAHGIDRFAQVYTQYYGAVYNYVYRLTLHKQDTEDIVSETFFQAMQGFSRYNAKRGAVLNWLCGIAHNRTMDFFRSRAAHTALSLEELLERGSLPEKARNEWMEGSAEWEVWDILRQLRVQERELLVLRYWLGLSNREIGVKLGVTEDAINKRILRTLAKCREIVKME